MSRTYKKRRVRQALEYDVFEFVCPLTGECHQIKKKALYKFGLSARPEYLETHELTVPEGFTKPPKFEDILSGNSTSVSKNDYLYSSEAEGQHVDDLTITPYEIDEQTGMTYEQLSKLPSGDQIKKELEDMKKRHKELSGEPVITEAGMSTAQTGDIPQGDGGTSDK